MVLTAGKHPHNRSRDRLHQRKLPIVNEDYAATGWYEPDVFDMDARAAWYLRVESGAAGSEQGRYH